MFSCLVCLEMFIYDFRPVLDGNHLYTVIRQNFGKKLSCVLYSKQLYKKRLEGNRV